VTRHRTADLEPMEFGGRYTLLRRLAVGGMAEIYLARQAAMAGFEKEVVIKKLRAELADDPRIVEMFLDEAKIGAQLNHPNIVHVYDVDEHDGIPYIAMEYIVGEELNELCRRGITYGRFLPLEHAVEVMRQAAAGMGYFHAKRGAEGSAQANQPLDIVHLDISPSNLLVTQDGFMKIIDFGIARARGQNTRTEVLPGKLSYMSPEQAARKDVDHRSDIFSLGIVLYEITVGKRLYRGPAAEVVHALIEGDVEPPTFARRNFPPALESIVMRTLEKHPEDRYQSAYDLADDLEAFLRDERLHSGPVRIARYLDMLTHAAGGTRRPELISETEARGTGEELDFDSQVFDGFAPSEGAPGPEQAPMWEDVDQPESEVAQALQIDLAELRALRTPVPMRPAGMAAVRGSGTLAAVAPPHDPGEDDGENAPATAPVPRMRTAEVYGDDEANDAVPELPQEDDGSVDVDIRTPPKPIPAVPDPRLGAEAAARLLGSARIAHDASAAPQAVVDRPSIGSAYLARTQSPSKTPWVVVAILGVVVLALLAYIVMK